MTKYKKSNERVKNKYRRTVMIKEDFFHYSLEMNMSRVFPVAVIATMSSGKSTLINAMLGKELLPNCNAACTSKVYSILNNHKAKNNKVYMIMKNNDVKVGEDNIVELLNDANTNEDVKEVLISTKINGVLNTGKSLMIIDTPGPNNSRDDSHEQAMDYVLNSINEGLILYVFNATQIGIKDDKSLLLHTKKYLQENPKLKIAFVINKIDEIDNEKESVEILLSDVKKYLQECGFENSDVMLASAIAANLFRKVLQNESLTRKEYKEFESCFELFETSDLRLDLYANMNDSIHNSIVVKGKEYQVYQILGALENTGIPFLERYIQAAQIKCNKSKEIRVRVRRR